MELDRVLRHVKHVGIAVGGYLVISTMVNIVDESEHARQAAEAQQAAYSAEIKAADEAARAEAERVLGGESTESGLAPEMAAPAVSVVTGSPIAAPTVPDGATPPAPSDVTTSVAGRVVTVGWTGTAGLTYQTELVGPDGVSVTTAEVAETRWIVEGLEPAHAHLVRVRSLDPATQAVSEWVEALFASPAD